MDMEQTTFDRTVARLGAGASRRHVFGVLLGAAALLGGGVASARKGGGGKGKANGKKKDKRNANGNGSGNGNGSSNGNGSGGGNGNGQGLGTTKISICHRDEETETFQLLTVAEPAWQGHARHGDTRCEPELCSDPNGCTFTCDAVSGVCTVEGSGGEEPDAG